MVQLQITHLEQVAAQLYDPARVGVISLPYALPPGFRTRALESLRDAPFERAPELYGKTTQDFSRFSHETHPIEQFACVKELALAHEQLHVDVGRFAGFVSEGKLTYNVLHYPGGSAGLGSHRDESFYRNLIAIYVLSGERDFVVGTNRELNPPAYVHNSPGSLILLRAPRNDSEKKLRPFHAVRNVRAPTTIISFRYEVTNGQNTHQ